MFKHKLDKKKQRILNGAVSVFIGVALFGLGWAYGSGKVNIKRYDTIKSNSGLPEKLDLSSVDTIYKSLRENFDGELDPEKLLEGIKSGLASATGDPYTEYFNPDDAHEFLGQIDGTFDGIGAELGKNTEGNIIIVSPLPETPAQRAGLQPKDIVAQVNGESTEGWTIDQARDKIRGEKGTTVKLTIVRGDSVEDTPIVRETIDIPSVKWEVRDGIGVMTIVRFEAGDTPRLARKAAEEFKAAGVKGVVLDMRGNPGGHLDAAVEVASLWLGKDATILTERRDNVVINTLKADGRPVLEGTKTVVLINEGSASASEIVAGALHDNNAATLVGQKTFGKGSVQQPINLGDGGLLKVTIARWFTPNGKNIDKEGIEPDQKVEYSAEDAKNNRDPQLDSALASLK